MSSKFSLFVIRHADGVTEVLKFINRGPRGQ